MSCNLIEVRELTKKYGAKAALENVSFSVGSGEVVGLLGLNGAGKSTTMNILTGYIKATSGSVTINGHDIVEKPREAKRIIGYLPEQMAYYTDMRVQEYLSFVCDLKGVKREERTLDGICEKVGIAHIRKRMIRNLSKGYRQRMGLAQALVGKPKVLILDEPTVGLDPSQITEIRTLIKEIGSTRTVIFSSHILSEVQALCSRVIVLHGGRLLADDSPGGLTREHGALRHRVSALIKGEPEDVLRALGALGRAKIVEQSGDREPGAFRYTVESEDGRDIREEVFRALAAADLPLLCTYASELSLEDVFLGLISGQIG